MEELLTNCSNGGMTSFKTCCEWFLLCRDICKNIDIWYNYIIFLLKKTINDLKEYNLIRVHMKITIFKYIQEGK